MLQILINFEFKNVSIDPKNIEKKKSIENVLCLPLNKVVEEQERGKFKAHPIVLHRYKI